jgi:hypothetical protein
MDIGSAGLPMNPGAGMATLAGYSAGIASAGISAPLSMGGGCAQAGTIITMTRSISPATASAKCPLFPSFIVLLSSFAYLFWLCCNEPEQTFTQEKEI